MMGSLVERWAALWSGAPPLSAGEAGWVAIVGLLGVIVLLQALAMRRSARTPEQLGSRLDGLSDGQSRNERLLREELARSRTEQSDGTRNLREEVSGSIRGVGETVGQRLDGMRDGIDLRLRHLQEENQKKLDEMRATVDEKLQGTLEKRLGEAFQRVSERLEAVHAGLGEMQSLAVGVGDLKKVLTNVKSRGTFGETQLEALLEHCLSPGQFEKQVPTQPGGRERVDFAIRLPGDGGEPIWLPIDAKFPQEDYLRLVDAQERADAAAADEAGKALEARVKLEAKSIREKYLAPPTTTDFALLFLPTEGLYAEVLRRDGLVERLQREYKVTLAGPTTLAALLNSLQMGFRTLAIQERSDEVWQLLGAVKNQFGNFGGLLEKVQKKLDEASNTIGAASAKTRYIERRLGRVEELPTAEAEKVLPSALEE